MYHADVIGSKAYAKALAQRAIITEEECDAIVKGLTTVEKEWRDGKFDIKPHDEDIHTANERRLGELIGTKISGRTSMKGITS